MKKILLFVFMSFLASSYSDVTFSWDAPDFSGTSGLTGEFFDETNTRVTDTTDINFKGLTFLTDLSSFVIGGEIDISHITNNPALVVNDINVAPFVIGDAFNTSTYSSTANAGDGNTPYLVIHHGDGSIGVGDFIGFGGAPTGVDSTDTQITSGNPPPTQVFRPTNSIIMTNIQVVPEPSTLFLFSLAGLVILRAYRWYK